MSFADARIDDRFPAYYEGVTADSGDEAPRSTVTFKYVEASGGAGAEAQPEAVGGTPGIDGDMGAGAPEERSEPVTSSQVDPVVGWREPDGVQAVAQAILTHYTGSEPDQAELEALVMAKGDVWASTPDWTLTVRELDEII